MASASQTILSSLVQIALEFCQAGTAALSLLDTAEDGEAIFRSTVLAGTLAPREIAAPRNFSPDGVCLDRATPQLFSHPERYFTYIQALNTPIVECLVLPLIAGSQTLGTIWIASHDENRHFDSEDLRVMATLADFTSTALQLDRPQTEQLQQQNARLEAEVADRRRAQEALLESEKRLLESAGMLERAERAGGLGHWTYDIVTQQMFWSPQARRIYVGECEFELSYEAAANLVHPDDLPDLLTATDEAIAQKRSLEAEYRIIRPDRSQAKVCLSADLDFDAAGQPVKMFGIVQDITDRQHIEAERLRSHEALRESEERWRATVENLPAGAVFVVDRNLRYLLAGGEALSAGGLEPEDIVGRRVSEMLPPELVADCEAEYRRALAGESFDREHNAHDRWYISRGTPLRSASGEVYAVLAVSYDITDRKRAEAALRDSEEKYRTLVCANSKMVWATDAEGNIVEEVPGWESFTGQTFDEYKNFGWLRALHPDDAERIGQIWQSSIAQHATAIGEYRLRSRSGDYRRFAVRGEPLLEADGKLRGWVGTIVDVEETRRAAAAEQAALDRLRESEEKYRSLFESIDEGYLLAEVIFDENDKPVDILYLEANPAAIRLAGRDFSGQRMREIDPHYEDYWYESYGGVALTGESVRAEHYAEPHGRWFDFYAFKVGGQESRRVATVFRDVTDRKKAEAALQESEERQAYLLRLSDALRPLSDPIKIQWQALNIVGEYLDLDRVLYNEIDPDVTTYTVHVNYVREGFPSYVGSYPMRPFAESVKNLRLGKTYVIYDAENEEQFSEEERAICRGINVQAFVVVPLIKQGQWVVNVVAHYSKARNWTQYDISILEETAERTWAAVERARAEAELRQSEVKYRSLFESIDEGYALCEVMYDGNERPVDVRYLQVNPAFEQLTGLENVVGKTAVELNSIVEFVWLETVAQVVQTGVAIRLEEYAEGLNRWLDVYFSRVGGEGSRQIAVVFNNITDRKRREANLAFLAQIAEDSSRLASEAEIMQSIGSRLATYLRLDGFTFADVDEGRESVTIKYGWNAADVPQFVGTFRLAEYMTEEFSRTMRAGETWVVCDTQHDERTDAQATAAIGAGAIINVPYHRRGEWQGCLTVTCSEVREWTADEIALIVEVSNRTFPRLERARAEEDLRQSEIQRVREQAAREEARQRAESLAELDRAKTLFFSNVSHEFRTPLTLILNPLEAALARLNSENDPGVDGDTIAARSPDSLGYLQESLQVAHRNSLRLLKLVNALLDFSRIEADRLQANYEATDLATYTAELASVFRSAIERANLQLIVDCPPLPEPIYVDRSMWEKIVLNLLSNAFKFTFEGTISVSLKPQPNSVELVELTISDTGTGIPEAELPHLFERFYQVKGAKGRSYEGSGIGLSLVQELVKRHGGSIGVTSTVGEGTSFTVTIPTGTAHLAGDRIGVASGRATTTVTANAFVEEALRWMPEQLTVDSGQLTVRAGTGASPLPSGAGTEASPLPSGAGTGAPPLPSGAGTGAPPLPSGAGTGAPPLPSGAGTGAPPLPSGAGTGAPPLPSPSRILLADDNADMRDYVRRLLGDRYEVTAVADGAAALAAARQDPPDLVLADVMMPEMDGFELLRSLRTDPQTQTVPIVLLSARAGEASRVEGLEMGADDYLIKPFSARELLARVDAHLQLAQMRREAIYRERVMQEVQTLNDRLEQQVKARTAQLEAVNEELEAFASAIAHDLRTPLRYINNFADRLRGKLEAVQIDASSLKSLDIIAQSALGAEKMVGDLLEFSRLGQTKMLLTTVIMDGLVQQVRSQLQPEPIARSLHWQIDPLPSVEGDPVLLQIVLQNLLSNAIKYTSHRERAEIAIGSIDREAEVVFFVRDNGAGFDMKYRDRLFTMFQRLHSQDEFAGTGVGLATVRRIVHRHGGRIWAEGAIDSGATFFFSLPKREVGT
jgi:PAS domain S-box-containing protein